MTESELIAKLKMKTDNQEWIDETLSTLKGFGYLKSDQVFAEQFVEQAFSGEFGSQYIVEKLKKLDIDQITPLDALNLLYNLKSKADK